MAGRLVSAGLQSAIGIGGQRSEEHSTTSQGSYYGDAASKGTPSLEGQAAGVADAYSASTSQSQVHINADGSQESLSKSQSLGPDGITEHQTRTLTSAPDEQGAVHATTEGTARHPDGLVTSFVERTSTMTDEHGNSVTSSVRQDFTPEGVTESRLTTFATLEDGAVHTLVKGTVTGPDGVTQDIQTSATHPVMSATEAVGYSSSMGVGALEAAGAGSGIDQAQLADGLAHRAAFQNSVSDSLVTLQATGVTRDQLEQVAADPSHSHSNREAASMVLAAAGEGQPLDAAYAQARAESQALSAEFSLQATALVSFEASGTSYSSPTAAGLQLISDSGLTRSELADLAAHDAAPFAMKDAAASVLAELGRMDTPVGASEVGLQAARVEAGELAQALTTLSQSGMGLDDLRELASSPELSPAQCQAVALVTSDAVARIGSDGASPDQAAAAALGQAAQFAENLGALAHSRVQAEELPGLAATADPAQALGGWTPAGALEALASAQAQAVTSELPAALQQVADANLTYPQLKELAQDTTAAPASQLAAKAVLDGLPSSAEYGGVVPEQIQEVATTLAIAEAQTDAARVAEAIEAAKQLEASRDNGRGAEVQEQAAGEKQAEQDAMSME